MKNKILNIFKLITPFVLVGIILLVTVLTNIKPSTKIVDGKEMSADAYIPSNSEIASSDFTYDTSRVSIVEFYNATSDGLYQSINSSAPSVSSSTIITISDAYQLDAFRKLTEANTSFLTYNYELNSDIDFTEALNQQMNPIGTATNPFSGTFNGNGFEISNLTIKRALESDTTYYDYYAFFNYNSGTISNLGIVNLTNVQTIKPENTAAASTLCGYNSGTIEKCYYIENRSAEDRLGGVAASGGFEISGFVYENASGGTITNSYIDVSILVSYAVTDYIMFREVLALNSGTISNLYFKDDTITSLTDGIYIYDKALVGIEILESDMYGNYASSLDALNSVFNQNSGWFNNSYYDSIPVEYAYPKLKGLLKYENDSHVLRIDDAYDYATMISWINDNEYFASSNMTYIVTQDIDLSIIPYELIQIDSYFSATLKGLTTVSGSLTLTDGTKVNTPTIYLNGKLNNLVDAGFDAYGLLPFLDGEVSSLNIYYSNTLDSFSVGSSSNTKAIGLVAGYAESSIIRNVNVYGNIVLETTDTTQAFGKFYVGGIVGVNYRYSTINSVTTSGSIKGSNSISGSTATQSTGYTATSAIGGIVGFNDYYSYEITNALNGISIESQPGQTIGQDIGGIVGTGYVSRFEQIANKGDILVNDQTGEINVSGIIGNLIGVDENIYKIHNQGNITLNLTSSVTVNVASIMNVDLICQATTYLERSKSLEFNISGVTNSSNIIINNSASATINASGMFNINSNNGFTSNLVGIYELSYKYSDDWNQKVAIDTQVIDISKVTKYAGILSTNSTNSSYNLTLKNAYNLKGISFETTSDKSISSDFLFSGVANGKNITFTDVRNEGDLIFTITNTLSTTGDIIINGLFEEISRGSSGSVLYNGGDITLNLTDNILGANTVVSGICYKSRAQHLTDDDYAVYNPLSDSYDKSLTGSLDSVINSGDITQCNTSDAVEFSYDIKMAGICAVNEAVLSQAFNLGDILNTTTMHEGVSSDIAGICFINSGKYAQIKDCANNGVIKNVNLAYYSSSIVPCYQTASGIVARNDVTEESVSVTASSMNHMQYILYTINYGEVIAYSRHTTQSINATSYSTPLSIASGILASGLTSMINTVNYGNIFGAQVSSGMIGNVDLSIFASEVTSTNPVTIANSINYAKVYALYRVRTVTGSPVEVTYSEVLSLDTTNSELIKNAYRSDDEYAGSVISILNYNSSTSAQYINIRYLINFNENVSLVGLEVNVPSIQGATSTMYTAMPNDRYLNSLIVYSPLSSTQDDDGNIGIFSPEFTFRKAIEGDTTVTDITNYKTDVFLADYFEFVAFSKINDSLLESIGWATIAYDNGASNFASDIDSLTTLLKEYQTITTTTNYDSLTEEALNTSTWIEYCDTSILSLIIEDILSSQDLTQLSEIVTNLFLNSDHSTIITDQFRKTTIETLLTELETTEIDLLDMLEALMYSDLIAKVIGESNSDMTAVKELINTYIEALDTASLETLATNYLNLLLDSTNTTYDLLFTDSNYAKERVSLLTSLLEGFDENIYKDILIELGEDLDKSTSIQMQKALETLTQDEINAIFKSILETNTSFYDIETQMISLLDKVDATSYIESTDTTVINDFATNSVLSDDNIINLWDMIKNDTTIQTYLENNLDTVYDVYNVAHKGLYAVATEYRNTYQSNNGYATNSFTLDSSTGNSTPDSGRYRAESYTEALDTRYIYTPDSIVSDGATINGVTYAETYFFGPYINGDSNTLWNSASSSYEGGAENINYSLFDNTGGGTTVRYVPVFIGLDRDDVVERIKNTSSPNNIYNFMWNNVSSRNSANAQWVSEDIITTVPGDSTSILKKNTTGDTTHAIYLGYDFTTAETATTNEEVSLGVAYQNVNNQSSDFVYDDVLWAYVTANLITGIYYQQNQWDNYGAYLTAKPSGTGSGIGVITTRYIDYSVSDLVTLDGKRTKGMSSGANDSDEISIILSVLNLLNETSEGKSLVMNAVLKHLLTYGASSANSGVAKVFFEALSEDTTYTNLAISETPYISTTYNLALNLTYNGTTYNTLQNYLFAVAGDASYTYLEQIMLYSADNKEGYVKVINYLIDSTYGYYSYLESFENTVYKFMYDNNANTDLEYLKLYEFITESGLTEAELQEAISSYNYQNINSYLSDGYNLGHVTLDSANLNYETYKKFIEGYSSYSTNKLEELIVSEVASNKTEVINTSSTTTSITKNYSYTPATLTVSTEATKLDSSTDTDGIYLSPITGSNTNQISYQSGGYILTGGSWRSADRDIYIVVSGTATVEIDFRTNSNGKARSIWLESSGSSSAANALGGYVASSSSTSDNTTYSYTINTTSNNEVYHICFDASIQIYGIRITEVLESESAPESITAYEDFSFTLASVPNQDLETELMTGLLYGYSYGDAETGNNMPLSSTDPIYLITNGSSGTTTFENTVTDDTTGAETIVTTSYTKYLRLALNGSYRIQITFSSNSTNARTLWISESNDSTLGTAINNYSVTSTANTYENASLFETTINDAAGNYYICFDGASRIYSIEIRQIYDESYSLISSFTLDNTSTIYFNTTMVHADASFIVSDGTNSYTINVENSEYYALESLPAGTYTVTYTNCYVTEITKVLLDFASSITNYLNLSTIGASIISNYTTYETYIKYYDRYYNAFINTNYTKPSNFNLFVVKGLYGIHTSEVSHPDKMLYEYLTDDELKQIIILLSLDDSALSNTFKNYAPNEAYFISVITDLCNLSQYFLTDTMSLVNMTLDTITDEVAYDLISAYIATDYALNEGSLEATVLYNILSEFDTAYQFITSDGEIDSEKFITLMQHLGFNLSTDGYGIYAMSSSAGILNGQFVPDNINLTSFDPYYDSNLYLITGESASTDAAWRGGNSTNSNDTSDTNSINYAFYVDMKQLKLSIATTIFELELVSENDSTYTISTTEDEIDLENGVVNFYIPSNSENIADTFKVNFEQGSYSLAYNASFVYSTEDPETVYSNLRFDLSTSDVSTGTLIVYAEDRTVLKEYTINLYKTEAIGLALSSATTVDTGSIINYEIPNPTEEGNIVTYDLRSTNTLYMLDSTNATLNLELVTHNLQNNLDLTNYISIDSSTEYFEFETIPYVKNSNEFSQTTKSFGDGTLNLDLLISSDLPAGDHTLIISSGSIITYHILFTKEAATEAEIETISMVDYTGEVVDVEFVNNEATTYIKYGRGYTLSDLTGLTNGIPNYLTEFEISACATYTISATYENATQDSYSMTYKVTYVITPEQGDSQTYVHNLVEQDPFENAKSNGSYITGDSYNRSNYVETLIQGQIIDTITPNTDGSISTSFERDDEYENVPNYRFNYNLQGFYGDDISDNLSVKVSDETLIGSYFNIDSRYYGFYIHFEEECVPGDYLFNLVYTLSVAWDSTTTYERSYTCPTITVTKELSKYALLDGITFIDELGLVSAATTIVSLEELSVSDYELAEQGQSDKITTSFTQNNGILYYQNNGIDANNYYIIGAVSGEELETYSPNFNLRSYSSIYQYIELGTVTTRYYYHEFVNVADSTDIQVFLVDSYNQVYSSYGLSTLTTPTLLGELSDNNEFITGGNTYTFSEYDGTASEHNTSLYMDYIGYPEDGMFWYINYEVISEDLTNSNDYHIAVIDLTSNIKYTFNVVDTTGTLDLDSINLDIYAYTAFETTGQSQSFTMLDPSTGEKSFATVLNLKLQKEANSNNYILVDSREGIEDYIISSLPYAYYYFRIELPSGYQVTYYVEATESNGNTVEKYDDSIQFYKNEGYEDDNSFLPKQSIVTQRITITMEISLSETTDDPFGLVIKGESPVEATNTNRSN